MTKTCPICGTLEALEAAGASDELKKSILIQIHAAKEGDTI